MVCTCQKYDTAEVGRMLLSHIAFTKLLNSDITFLKSIEIIYISLANCITLDVCNLHVYILTHTN